MQNKQVENSIFVIKKIISRKRNEYALVHFFAKARFYFFARIKLAKRQRCGGKIKIELQSTQEGRWRPQFFLLVYGNWRHFTFN